MFSPLTPIASLPHLLAVSPAASSLAGFITNSVLVALIVLGIVLWVGKKATTNMTLVPHWWQNFFEFIVEFLYAQVESVAGKKMAPKAFPLLGTLFVFILISNWFGLLPGVGTIGWGEGTGARR